MRQKRFASFAVMLCLFVSLSKDVGAQNAQVLPLPPSVIVVDWSTDGARIAGGTTDGRLYVWDAITGEELLTFSALTEQLLSLVWSPEGNQLVSGGVDGVIRVWNAKDGQLLHELPPQPSNVLALDWSPDGSQLASVNFGGENNLRIWDAETYTLINAFNVGDVFGIDWSPDGQRLVLAHGGGGVFTVDPFDPQPYQPFDIQEPAASVAWNSDGSLLAIGNFYNGDVYIWDVAKDTQVTLLKSLGEGVNALVWTDKDSQLITIGVNSPIQVWDVAIGNVLDSFRVGSAYLRQIDLSPYGVQLAYGGPLPSAETAPFVVEPGQRTLSNGLVRIVVPAPSKDKLKALIEACGAAPELIQALHAGQFEAVQQATTLPPGCAADLVAVAEALKHLR